MSEKKEDKHLCGDVTVLLRELAGGASDALPRLITELYPDLKKIAERRMRSERSDHTLQASALVSELFLETARCQRVEWRDRTHFLAVASQMMRRFLIDYARARSAQSRGGGLPSIELRDLGFRDGAVDLLIINDVIDRLAAEEPRMAKVVEMRCFGGLTHAEISLTLGIEERTVKRDWQVGRAWLRAQLKKRLPG